MTKLIGLKELQQNTKKIREAVAKGVHFIVIYRSKPIFEITPVSDQMSFAENLASTKLYKQDFIDRMTEAEANVREGHVRSFSTEDFLKSL